MDRPCRETLSSKKQKSVLCSESCSKYPGRNVVSKCLSGWRWGKIVENDCPSKNIVQKSCVSFINVQLDDFRVSRNMPHDTAFCSWNGERCTVYCNPWRLWSKIRFINLRKLAVGKFPGKKYAFLISFGSLYPRVVFRWLLTSYFTYPLQRYSDKSFILRLQPTTHNILSDPGWKNCGNTLSKSVRPGNHVSETVCRAFSQSDRYLNFCCHGK